VGSDGFVAGSWQAGQIVAVGRLVEGGAGLVGSGDKYIFSSSLTKRPDKLQCLSLASLLLLRMLDLINVCREIGSLLSFAYIFGRVARRCC
jgi:hypothetical protein